MVTICPIDGKLLPFVIKQTIAPMVAILCLITNGSNLMILSSPASAVSYE